MPNRLRISLVIPVYNEESHLTGCLEAALVQSEKFYEIIVVDNNSTDETYAVATSFAGVKVLRESLQGIVYARNRGFNAAHGDVIARIDADTVLPTDWAAHLQDFYADGAHDTSAWTCSGVFTDAPMPRIVSAGYRLVAVHINRWLTGYPSLWGSSMAVPKDVWQAVAADTCEGLGFHEDLDLATHLHRAGIPIHWDKHMLVRAELRHAWTSREDLWEYLQWWPRTLRRHGQKSWILCWLGGTLAMYCATLLFGQYKRVCNLLSKSGKAREKSRLEVTRLTD